MYEVKPLQKHSKKGTEYWCLEITFPNGYKKIVYLETAEQYMISM